VATGASGFDWDEGNRAKCQEHGLNIADIEFVLATGDSVILPATGFEESRFIAIGLTTEGRLALIVFTRRDKGSGMMLRPICARYMHRKEIRKYGQAIASLQKRRGS
jgi:uncharacterized DUF497 family protein